jgi:hypothetical protein
MIFASSMCRIGMLYSPLAAIRRGAIDRFAQGNR